MSSNKDERPNGRYLPKSELSLDIPSNFPAYHGSSDFIINDTPDESCVTSSSNWCKTTVKKIFSRKTLYKRLPILTWLPKYNSQDAIGDLVAGITVGLTVIPQALAYAGIANLPAAYGLYGSFLGCFIYIFLGSSKDVPVGPTAIAALLVAQTAQGIWQRAVLLTFFTGIIEVLMGVLQLGFLIDFVSGPVSAGFTSAVSLIILTSQMKDIFGIKTTGSTFLDMWISIINNINNIRIGDTLLGFGCIVVLLGMRLMVNIQIGPKETKEKSWWQKIITNTIWLIGTARNAVLVVVCGAIGAYVVNEDYFLLIGDIPAGMPNFQPPPFSIGSVVENGTIIQQEESFSEMVSNLGSGLIVVPLISLLENMAVVTTFANGKPADATQELIAVGVANIANSFVQGFRGNGALARGAVNNASGVRTPLGNLYTGVLVIVALLYFTPYFYFIPKAALAAIIIAAVIFMIQYRVVKPMWRSKKTDLIPGLAAFFACLVLPLQIGILVGIGINIVFILYHAARPKLRVERLTVSCKDLVFQVNYY
ncbi:SLC26A11.2 family protein [Megaselia abdita]